MLRASLLFVWRDERGDTWRDVIRRSARGEFEAARGATDGEEVTRLLLGGRAALDDALARFLAKRRAVIEDEARRREGEEQGRGEGAGGAGGARRPP